MAIITSRLRASHWVWIGNRLRADANGLSPTLTPSAGTHFPVPTAYREEHEADLTRCAEDIVLAREAHFPATLAELYDGDRMDIDYPDLRAAHNRNDEVLERIYIGRRFKNDTERLEKLFELYTKMTAGTGAAKKQKARANA